MANIALFAVILVYAFAPLSNAVWPNLNLEQTLLQINQNVQRFQEGFNETFDPILRYEGFTPDEVNEIISAFKSISEQPGMPDQNDKTWFRTLAAGIAKFLGDKVKAKGYERFDLVMCHEPAIMGAHCIGWLPDFDDYFIVVGFDPRIFNIWLWLSAFQNEERLLGQASVTAEPFVLDDDNWSTKPATDFGISPEYCMACPGSVEPYSCPVISAIVEGSLLRQEWCHPGEAWITLNQLPNLAFGNVACAVWEWDADASKAIPPTDVYFHFAKPMVTHCEDGSPILPGKHGFLVVSEKLMKNKTTKA